MHIDRCVCCDRLFSDLHAKAQQHDAWTVDALQDHATFGTGCGLCLPYVRRMLRTGEVVFHEIVTDHDEPPV